MEINPSIMVPIIDKLLGGGNWSHKYIPERSASDVETNLFKEFVLKPCLVEISKSLNFVHDGISFQLGEFDTNPMLVSVVPSNEVVILSCFEVKMGDTSGMLNVCIPYPAIEHVMDSLSTINTLFKRDNKSGNDRCVTEHDIGSTVMELIVYERFKNAVSLKEVGEFKEGAVISLCRNAKRNPNLFKMSIDGVEKTQVEVSWAADANKNNPIVYDSGVKVN
jgi:flagellar motor switch protein FliM